MHYPLLGGLLEIPRQREFQKITIFFWGGGGAKNSSWEGYGYYFLECLTYLINGHVNQCLSTGVKEFQPYKICPEF